jgi:hypothetical protein
MKIEQKHSSSKSQFIGLAWDKRDKKWLAQIAVQCRTIHLGSYTKEHEAAAAYNYGFRLFSNGFYKVVNFHNVHEARQLEIEKEIHEKLLKRGILKK